MHASDHVNSPVIQAIKDPVWKPWYHHSANIRLHDGVGLRILADLAQGRSDSEQKLVPEMRLRAFVPRVRRLDTFLDDHRLHSWRLRMRSRTSSNGAPARGAPGGPSLSNSSILRSSLRSSSSRCASEWNRLRCLVQAFPDLVEKIETLLDSKGADINRSHTYILRDNTRITQVWNEGGASSQGMPLGPSRSTSSTRRSSSSHCDL